MTEESTTELLPVRMLNEFAYCPRLFYLMHVEGRWDDNAYTADGREKHKRVDQLDHVLPDPSKGTEAASDQGIGQGDDPPTVSRSVSLGSERLGLTAKLDLVSTAGDEAVPVETKRGKVPNNEQRSWEPERVQLMAQGLLLRENGYACDHGVLYFAGSRTRVDIQFTPELEARTCAFIEQARLATLSTEMPEPLENSPKCPGCSLNGICLPDETLTLNAIEPDRAAPDVRRLYPMRADALPFYVQEQGAIIGKTSKSLTVKKQGIELARVGLKDVSQLVVCGNIMVTEQAIHLLCEAGIPIVHLSSGNWFYGITAGITLKNSYNRAAQYQAAADPQRHMTFAREVVRAKGMNQRTMLRRNARPRPDDALNDMSRQLGLLDRATDPGMLLGYEGTIASHYFAHFATMLSSADLAGLWSEHGRNRRPPKDPINAMLSFGYAMLAKECTIALMAEGLDPWWGIYHQPRHGRPALALDVMEQFRPLIVDSAVITAVNTGMVKAHNFVCSQAGCSMQPAARKAFIHAYEARLDQLVTHPVFDYRCSWRSVIRLQCTLLARWLRGDIPEHTGFTTR